MRTLILYLVAAAVWISIGVFVPDFMLSWPVTIGYLLIVAWLGPALVRRLR